MLNAFRILGVAAAFTAAFAIPASARTLVYGAGIPSKHPIIKDSVGQLFQRVEKETGGSLKWKILAGNQVITMRTSLDGLRDSLVDAALIVPVFQRKELLSNNVIFDTQFMGTNPVAVAGAATETVMLDCPECTKELREHNAVHLGDYASTPFHLVCNRPVRKLSEVGGLKTRATGSMRRWVEAMGGIPVSMSPSDMVQAIDRGVLDCMAGPIAWLTSYGLMDVAKYVVDFPAGIARNLGHITMNRKTWRSLSRAERAAILKHVPESNAHATIQSYIEVDKRRIARAKKEGVEFIKVGPEFAALRAKHIESEMKTVPRVMKKQGAKNPEATLAAFLKNLDKWEKLSKEIGNDQAKLAQALRDNVYSKVGVDSF